jgi:curved DNA-binding protein CbpA
MTETQAPRDGLALFAEAFRARRSGLLSFGDGADALRVRLESGQVTALGPAPAETKASLPKPSDSVRLRLERVLAEIGMLRAIDAGVAPADGSPAVPPAATLRDRLIDRLAEPSEPVRFEEGAPSPRHLVEVAVATEPIILEAVRLMRRDEAVRRALGDLDLLLVATTAFADERTLTLTEGYLLSRIDGIATARQVLELVPLEPSEVERTLLGLLLTGRVECRAAPARDVAFEAEPATPAAPPPPEPIAEAVAEVSPTADTAEQEPIVVDEDILAEPARAPEPAAAAAPSPPPAEPEPLHKPPAASEVPPMDAATVARRRAIVELFQSLPLKQNHFEVLGVEPGCSDDEVKRAYVSLTKRYHPDANRDKRLQDLHDMLEAIIIRVGEAWEVLGEAKSRASYEARSGFVRRPRGSGEAEEAARPPAASAYDAREYVPPEEILFRARRLLAQAQYWDAIQVLESALPGMEPRSQQHRGRLLLARAYSKNPNWLRRAEETLQQLMREDPTNADAHYELGLVYKTGGFQARAQTMFKRAVELRPGHKEASAELGISTEVPEKPSEGGLLKRLFKRGKAS